MECNVRHRSSHDSLGVLAKWNSAWYLSDFRRVCLFFLYLLLSPKNGRKWYRLYRHSVEAVWQSWMDSRHGLLHLDVHSACNAAFSAPISESVSYHSSCDWDFYWGRQNFVASSGLVRVLLFLDVYNHFCYGLCDGNSKRCVNLRKD